MFIMFFSNLIGASHNIANVYYYYLDHFEKKLPTFGSKWKRSTWLAIFLRSVQVAGNSIFIFGSTHGWNSSWNSKQNSSNIELNK